MKSGEVLKLLGINRTRLMNYVKNGDIKAIKQGNRYEYDDEDVHRLAEHLRDAAYYMKQNKSQVLKIFEKCEDLDCNIIYVDDEKSFDNFSTMIEKAIFDKSFRKIIIDKDAKIPMDIEVLKSQLAHVGCELVIR